MKKTLCKRVAELALLFVGTLPVLAADRHVLNTQVPSSASNLPMLQRMPATDILHLAIGLPLRNPAVLSNLLQQLYDQHSTNYHRFLTPDQFAEQFGPTENDYQSVIAFAKSNRLEVVRTYGNRALVDVDGQASDIEKAFQVHLGFYQHPTENRQFFAPDTAPSVDAGLSVLFISGLDNYKIPRPHGHVVQAGQTRRSTPNGGSYSNGAYIGSDFRNAYLPGTQLTGAGQVVGLFELQGYTPGDVQAYESAANISPQVPVVNVLASYGAGTNVQNWECVSDIELAIAMAPGLKQVSVYEGNNSSSIIAAIATTNTASFPLPKQVSCSWDVDGDTSIEQGLIQLAMQGQSFLYALGDNGAYANGALGGTEQDLLYMTAVGGTQLFMNGAGLSYNREVVWHDSPGTNFQYFSTAGGILPSDPIPFYQQTINMTLNQGSSQDRNVPDVALVSRDIEIVYTSANANGSPHTGNFGGWVGTSASAPLWAGIIALVNQQTAAQGKPPVGFLNPALYEIAQSTLYASCFHDITNGNNSWYNSANGTGSDNLYNAVPGYDLCTGWGSPASVNLINALVGYAGPVFVNFNYTGSPKNGQYNTPYNTLAAGVSAVANSGTIFIETAGSSAETMTITKPMTITAQTGAATVGHN